MRKIIMMIFMLWCFAGLGCLGRESRLEQIDAKQVRLLGQPSLSASVGMNPGPLEQWVGRSFLVAPGIVRMFSQWSFLVGGDTIGVLAIEFREANDAKRYLSNYGLEEDGGQLRFEGHSLRAVQAGGLVFLFRSHPSRPLARGDASQFVSGLGFNPQEDASGFRLFPQLGMVPGSQGVDSLLFGRLAGPFLAVQYQGEPVGPSVARSVRKIAIENFVKEYELFRVQGVDTACSFPAVFAIDTLDGGHLHISRMPSGEILVVWGDLPWAQLSEWARKVVEISQAMGN